MEAKGAWLLFAGAFLGFVGSLLATFAAPPLSNAFGKLKSGFIERNKARALAAYAEVRELKSGENDKYLYALKSWSLIIFNLVLFALFSIIAQLSNFPTSIVAHMVGAVVLLILLARRLAHHSITFNRLANFEDYRAELLRRWPASGLESPNTGPDSSKKQ